MYKDNHQPLFHIFLSLIAIGDNSVAKQSSITAFSHISRVFEKQCTVSHVKGHLNTVYLNMFSVLIFPGKELTTQLLMV